MVLDIKQNIILIDLLRDNAKKATILLNYIFDSEKKIINQKREILIYSGFTRGIDEKKIKDSISYFNSIKTFNKILEKQIYELNELLEKHHEKS